MRGRRGRTGKSGGMGRSGGTVKGRILGTRLEGLTGKTTTLHKT
jgi:hypothetical protein